MEINVMEPTVWNSYTRGGKAEMTYRYGWYGSVPPAAGAKAFTSGHSTFPMHHVDDPGYNEIYYNMVSTCDEEEQARLCREADLYAVSHHFLILILPKYSYSMVQPWIKNYNGEFTINSAGYIWARTWIDQTLKESMGH
jgi:ABC-type transport system substrate-binding protein